MLDYTIVMLFSCIIIDEYIFTVGLYSNDAMFQNNLLVELTVTPPFTTMEKARRSDQYSKRWSNRHKFVF